MTIRFSRKKSLSATLHILWISLVLWALPAHGQNESVELDTSTREISIEPDFNGAEIVIFGSVDNSKQATSASGYYDVIVVIRGPDETIIARQKKRLAGIWINGDSRTFEDVPSFYGVLSNRPIDDIIDEETRHRFNIEFNPAPNAQIRPPPDKFEDALIRVKNDQGMYVKAPFAVVFLSKSLFRATLEMPAQVLEGNYTAQIYLFHAGKLLSWDKSLFEVKKAGLERYLYTLATEQPWAYGILAVIVAVTCGLLGWTLFSRN